MSVVPLSRTESDQEGNPALSRDLAGSLIQLLEDARRDLGSDVESAKALIERASSPLQVEVDRRAH